VADEIATTPTIIGIRRESAIRWLAPEADGEGAAARDESSAGMPRQNSRKRANCNSDGTDKRKPEAEL